MSLRTGLCSLLILQAACASAPPPNASPAPRQAAAPPPAEASAPPARPADVASIDAIIAALYEVISGPAGQDRDWNRFRSLFTAGARLIVAAPSREGRVPSRSMSVEDYVTGADAMLKRDGFWEREIASRVERYGNVAHVFSTYEMRTTPDGPVFGRGVNSIELYWDGARWWIAAAVWIDEAPSHPLPAELLPR